MPDRAQHHRSPARSWLLSQPHHGRPRLEASIAARPPLTAGAPKLLPVTRVLRPIARVTWPTPVQRDDHSNDDRHHDRDQQPPHDPLPSRSGHSTASVRVSRRLGDLSMPAMKHFGPPELRTDWRREDAALLGTRRTPWRACRLPWPINGSARQVQTHDDFAVGVDVSSRNESEPSVEVRRASDTRHVAGEQLRGPLRPHELHH